MLFLKIMVSHFLYLYLFYEESIEATSAEQVRQPIYTSGLDYWKNYENYLDALKNNLNF